MFTLVRAIVYATIFVTLVFVLLPAWVLEWSGVAPLPPIGPRQIAAIAITVFGAAIALSSVLSFVWIGKGTPAPFDPPRKLVVRGPYAFVRNPMYIGAFIALAGAAIYFWSWPMLGYTFAFAIATHLFVVAYEEPTLRRLFGPEHDQYCSRTRRWLPRLTRSDVG